MKLKNILLYAVALSAGMVATSCDDFLDREPITNITPNSYFKADTELAAYTINYYHNIFRAPRGGYNAGPANWDDETDNMVVGDASLGYFADNYWLVGKGQAMDFGMIRVCNYFFDQVLPKQEAGKISGNLEMIKHYIGEMYFMRAATYFNFLKAYGDYPIITEVLPDDKEVLVEASRRAPRNEVAKFILSDLDKAISMCKSKAFNKNRINKEAAQLLKARVALYEATFEKYHKGTGRVPGDSNWPGAKMEYNAGKSFNTDADVDFFLSEAMDASKAVADVHQLADNSHVMNPEYKVPTGWNPYYEMFCAKDLSTYDEVILWKSYSKKESELQGYHPYIQQGGNNGLTKSYVDAFLMSNGLPIYAAGSGYTTDDSKLDNVKANRDERLQLFMFGETSVLYNDVADGEGGGHEDSGKKASRYYEAPTVVYITEHRDLTGFRGRKWMTYDQMQINNGINGENGFPEMRAAEAYLIYMEASYLKNKTIDASADSYWRALRRRAGVSEDYKATIAATDMNKEENEVQDWAVCSGDQIVDATLYNIRRERRCEFIGEGMRGDDLRRWRSFDYLFKHQYMPQGMNFWTSMYKHENYIDEVSKKSSLIPQEPGKTDANVSSPEYSKYLFPYRKVLENNEVADGFKWKKAHYLSPLGARDLALNVLGEAEVPQVYQNPYWPDEASKGALE